jgi:hypothetical protein
MFNDVSPCTQGHRRNFSVAWPEKEQGTDADFKGNLQEKRTKSKSTSSRHQSSQLGQNFSQVAFDKVHIF